MESRYSRMKRLFCGSGYNDRYPPEGFVAQLHALDPNLVVRWSNQIGRWVVLWENKTVPYRQDHAGGADSDPRLLPLFVVQNEDGSCRELDGRALAHLAAADTHTGGGRAEWFRQYRKEERRQADERARDADRTTEAMAREGVNYLRSLR
jgi:hypothetical protein